MERKYSVSEIQQMREALKQMNWPASMVSYSQREIDERVERQLQTYMMNGTEPDELTRAANSYAGQMYSAYNERNAYSEKPRSV